MAQDIRALLQEHGFNVVYNKGITLQNILYKRTFGPPSKKTNVVYVLSCQNCPAVYVGQTQDLDRRLEQHRSAIRNDHPDKSNVAKHKLSLKHEIDFKNPFIAHYEKNYFIRTSLEAFEIEKRKLQGIPLMNDKQNSKTCIPKQYLALYK